MQDLINKIRPFAYALATAAITIGVVLFFVGLVVRLATDPVCAAVMVFQLCLSLALITGFVWYARGIPVVHIWAEAVCVYRTGLRVWKQWFAAGRQRLQRQP